MAEINLNSSKKEVVTKAIKAEYRKCIKDPMYFMKKYVKIQNPVKGTVNFDLYDFQEDALQKMIDNRFTIILKARQMGISTLVAAYSLYLMTFFKDKNILVISITQETAKEIVTRVRYAYDKLPVWMKPLAEIDNRLSLRLNNGSQIKAVSSTSSSGRSSALSLLIIDEAAFISEANSLWVSAQPALSTGGRACILSTPNGALGFFHKMWVDAEAKANNFVPIKMPWYLHPDRDQNWRDAQTDLLGVKQAAQENDCDFLTSGDNAIPLKILEKYRTTEIMVMDPIERRGPINEFWVWERPLSTKNYMISADCSRGDGTDYSAFHVFDLKTMEQVAEYKGKITTKEYGNILVAVATEYNDAILVIENNNVGWATIQQVIDRGYRNLFYGSNRLNVVDIEKSFASSWTDDDNRLTAGFTTTNTNRQLLINNMIVLVQNFEIKIHSTRLITELSTFIWKDGKPQAMKGYNDDLIMAFSIGLWVRNTALRMKIEQYNLNQNMLNAIKVNNLNANHFANKNDFLSNIDNTLESNNKLFDKNTAISSWFMPVGEGNNIYKSNAIDQLNLVFGRNIPNEDKFSLKELLY